MNETHLNTDCVTTSNNEYVESVSDSPYPVIEEIPTQMNENNTNVDRRSIWRINKNMVLSKVAYFFAFVPIGLMVLFNTVFLISLGLSTQQSGLINGLRTVSRIFGAPLWGWVADRTKGHRAIMMILCLGSIIFTLPQPWIAYWINEPLYKEHVPFQSQGNSASRMQNLSMANLSTSSTYKSAKVTKDSSELLFGAMLTLNLLSSFFEGPIIGFLATITMQKVSRNPFKCSFGRQRAFGAIGWGLSAFAAGYISDVLRFPNVSPYTPVFILYTSGMTCFMVAAYFYFRDSSALMTSTDDSTQSKGTAWKSLMKTMKMSSVIFFFVVVLLSGVSSGIYDGYLLVHLKDLDSSKTIMGMSRTAANVTGTVFFFFSKKVMKLLGGEWNAMTVSSAVYSLRFLCFSLMDKPIYVIPIQFSNCFAFSMSWAAFVQHTNNISDTETKTTLYGIVNSLHFGLGPLLANIVGGIFYQRYGSVALFQGCSILCGSLMMAIIFYLSLNKFNQKRKDISAVVVENTWIDNKSNNENSTD